jgi:REP element-mobilizing transposase RayT
MSMIPVNVDLPPETLEELLDRASACAVALQRVGAEQFAVIVGCLSTRGYAQMRRAINKHWTASSQRDLNRTVGLFLDEEFFYLVAKYLPQSDYLLSLLFAPSTPLVRIRQDMTNAMRHVLECIRDQTQNGERLERSLQFVLKPYPTPDSDQKVPSKPAGGRAGNYARSRWFKGETVPDQNNANPSENLPGWQPIPQTGSQNVASQNLQPEDLTGGEAWVPLDELMSGGQRASAKTVESPNKPHTSPFLNRHAIPDEKLPSNNPPDWQPLEEASHPGDDLVRLFHEDFDLQEPATSPTLADAPLEGTSVASTLSEAELAEEETQPHSIDREEAFAQIKLSDITFYLVPRQDAHYILGELAQRLRNWFPEICKTYGWQLDTLSVRPDYLKWRLRDFPDALIHEMLEIVRARTSERIFRVFPNLQKGNPTRDFWSPGYLVDRQNQDFSTQILIAHFAKGKASRQND